MIKNANTDLISGIIGLVTAMLFWLSIDPEVSNLSIMFPRAMIYFLVVFAVALIFKGLTRAHRVDMFAEGNNIRWIVTGILLFLWITGVAYIGFWVSSVVFISIIVYYLSLAQGKTPLLTVIVWVGIVIAIVTFFYLVFSQLLHVPLPADLLF